MHSSHVAGDHVVAPGDRELLKLAAKAAGLALVEVPVGHTDMDYWAYPAGTAPNTAKPWNPLTDDGDALRLAVKLCLEIAPIEGGGVDVGHTTEREPFGELLATECGPDPYAATRRAIVRAAAAIAPDATQTEPAI